MYKIYDKECDNMKSKKNKILLEKKNNTIITHRILGFLIIIVLSIVLLLNTSNAIKPQDQVFKGKINSINAAANMLDALDTEDNTVISPLNINLSLGILYNATDNNTKKEIKNYFKEEPLEINNSFQTKIAQYNTPIEKQTNYELYEEFINEMINNSYLDLTLNNIEKLNQADKEKLILLTIQTDLAFNRMTNNQDAKSIKEYKLNDKERAYNSYQIKELLDKVINNYSTYRINNRIKNYNAIFYNQDLKIEKNFQKTINSVYKTSFIPLDYSDLVEAKNTINNNFKEFNPDINRVLSDNDLVDNNLLFINSLSFNYKWKEEFEYKGIIDSEFISFADKHFLVEMMYSKEKIYLENNFATGFIKNFADDKYSFIAILPKENGNFNLSKLDLENLLKNQKKADVLIGLPKFNYTATTDLNKIYKALNIEEIGTNKANISKMTTAKETIGKNIQKINISIGDKGTINSGLISLSIDSFNTDEIDRKVILNRPFAYLIIDNETQETILIGKYTTPND